jgi:probable selenium-dependent hydroxylase accessory protein YqeC
MRISKYSDGSFRNYDSLSEALGLESLQNTVISAVGAGGKTTILARLASELSGNGQKILITTNTHIALPGEDVFFSDQPEEIKRNLPDRSFVVAGHRFGSDKLEGLPEEVYTDLCRNADAILVEADGSRGRPLKVPAAHEPCIPANTSMLLVLAGLDSIGQRIEDVCHRPEEVRGILNTSGEHRITAADIALLLEKGYLEPFSKQFASIVILNKADSAERQKAAAGIAALLAPVPVLMTGRDP